MNREASRDHPWWAAASDRGPKRPRNEDAFAASADGRLLVVADGMGGHDDGAEAARLACATIAGARDTGPSREEGATTFLDRAIREAHRRVRIAADPGSLRPMGTTVVAVLLGDAGRIAVAHVGDSRAFLFEGGVVKRLTQDHSEVAGLVRAGTLTDAEARHHPLRNRLTRAVGIDDGFAPEVSTFTVAVDARLLLCTDGLWERLDDDELAAMLQPGGTAQATADAVVAAALARGADDNVTALVVDLARLGSTGDESGHQAAR